MSTLRQFRENLGRSWESVTEGWRHLYERASGALTRFAPIHRGHRGESGDGPLVAQGARWGLLAAEVFDDDDQVVVKLETPGMEPGDFDLQVVDGVLVVRGEKKFQRERSEGQYHIMECAYGRFERAIPLPVEVDDSKAEARYVHGRLRISLPKAARQRKRRIAISRD